MCEKEEMAAVSVEFQRFVVQKHVFSFERCYICNLVITSCCIRMQRNAKILKAIG